MSFLIDQIKDQKLLEMEVSLDEFIKENNISESAMIYEMSFSKDVFKEEKEVREYLKDKYFYSPSIVDNGEMFIASLVASSQFDDETEIEIELRRGVKAKAADLLPVMSFEDFNFNAKGEVNLSSKFGTINLSEGLPHVIEIARVAEGEHPTYGKLKITEENLLSMEENFKSKVTGVDLSINEDHKKNEAFGWFKDVFRSFDGQVLYGQVAWNPKGTTALSEKSYRYFSPEFRFNYKHPLKGTEHGATLLGGALTNYPFLKMEAIVELNNKNNKTGEIKVSKENTIDLSEYNSKVVELSGKIQEVTTKLSATEKENVELNNKVKTLEEKIKTDEKKTVHQKLFAENKINKAQLVALNEGKGMLEVLSMNEKMNTVETGTSDADETSTVELSSKEKSIATQLGLSDEEFIKYNK